MAQQKFPGTASARVGQQRGVRAPSLCPILAHEACRSIYNWRCVRVRAWSCVCVSAPRVRPRLDLLTWRPSATYRRSRTSTRVLSQTDLYPFLSHRVVAIVVIVASSMSSWLLSSEDVKVSTSYYASQRLRLVIKQIIFHEHIALFFIILFALFIAPIAMMKAKLDIITRNSAVFDKISKHVNRVAALAKRNKKRTRIERRYGSLPFRATLANRYRKRSQTIFLLFLSSCVTYTPLRIPRTLV